MLNNHVGPKEAYRMAEHLAKPVFQTVYLSNQTLAGVYCIATLMTPGILTPLTVTNGVLVLAIIVADVK
jgi:hypothetical protein